MLQRPKGTKDLLPEDTEKLRYIENKIENICEKYDFKEIRVPVFEHTELFQRGVGETTDVVQKEMYTFDDKGGRSITLRPEGTAGVVRAYIENGMASLPSPQKYFYNMAMYRYENVQKGRLREFHQIGAEVFGSDSYLADVEVILLASNIFKTLNISNIKLYLNSIGCPKCRAEYQKVLKEFLSKNIDKYCKTCQTRFEKNPMRILDCKEKTCKELNKGAPVILDYLCEECKEHFENVKKSLDKLNIKYEIDAGIVRGLDYYTKTVFEFVVDEVEGYTVLGGGRYDKLVEEIGGQSTPAIGFATGVERLMEVYERNNDKVQEKVPDLYIVATGENENIVATKLAYELRNNDIYVVKDINARSFKAQFKYADKIKAKYVIVIGENEINSNTVKVKNMKDGTEKEVSLNSESIKKELI